MKAFIFDWNGTIVDHNSTPYPDAKTTLLSLKERGDFLGVISTASLAYIEESGHGYGLTDLFDVAITSSMNKSRDIEAIMKTYELDPSQTYYVGDTVYDVSSASAANVISVGLDKDPKQPLAKSGAAHTIKSLSDLLDLA